MTLNYSVIGQGPQPILLLNGWGCAFAYWQPLMQLFESAGYLKKLTFYGADYPGYAENVHLSVTLTQYVADLCQILPKPFHIWGWSLGGALAIQCAVDNVDAVATLVFFNSNPCFVKKVAWPGVSTLKTIRATYLQSSQQALFELHALIAPECSLDFYQDPAIKKSLLAPRQDLILWQGLDFLSDCDFREYYATLTGLSHFD